MAKYRVAYVDESDADTRRFQRFSFNHFDVVPIKPLQLIEDTCAAILDAHIEAIIADFDFGEQVSNVHYDGTDLVSEFLKKREGFPVFILTSFEDDAISKGEDVNIIYEKKEMDEGEMFLERVKAQIEKYKHKLEEDQKQLIELITASRTRQLDAFEKQELKRLDKKIESALDKESQIPDQLRDESEASELSELLKKVDELTKKLDTKDE